ncbi:MAG: CHAP domain-containing protein [Hyphomonadaceae bacterium]|nr:CHAP domain-containing protein [Hyphomonadaceae bacterium]
MALVRSASSAFAFLCWAGISAGLLLAQSGMRMPAATAATETPPATIASSSVDAAPVVARIDRTGPPLQCAIYARQRTGLELSGEARNWWPQADGRYRRASTPSAGAVIVMGGTEAGHVAVVARVLSARQIVVDHANWLGGGEIITGALVEDASAANDWSTIRVWNVETNSMGLRDYPVYGFVGPGPA